MDVEETYEGGSQESGSVHFKTMIECHVVLDVHTIVQKWNSYHFVSRPYHKLLSNLVQKV